MASKKFTPPIRKRGIFSWDLEKIRSARNCQMLGNFESAVRMAEAMMTDDAIFTAFQARVSTQSAIKFNWHPSSNEDASRSASALAERLVHIPTHVRASILGTLANHGVAVGYIAREVLSDGREVRYSLQEWPLEHVRYETYPEPTLRTLVQDGPSIDIKHGDGFWVVFRKFGLTPWARDAALLPASFIWAAHTNAIADWAGATSAHGRPSVVGSLPEGVRILKDDGTTLTDEAQGFLDTLQAIISGDTGAGIVPAGAEVKYLSNASTAWQVFDTLGLSREKAAMRIYLGTDAALGSQGGAPGVDVLSLLTITTTRIQGDLEALERGIVEGVVRPWGEEMGIDVSDLPFCKYAIPDADGERRGDQEAKAIERLEKAVSGLKSAGVAVTQPVIDSLRTALGVTVACELAQREEEDQAVPIELAPADVARVVKVKEARLSQGLQPLGDERDDLFISELQQKAEAEAEIDVVDAEAEAEAEVQTPPPE